MFTTQHVSVSRSVRIRIESLSSRISLVELASRSYSRRTHEQQRTMERRRLLLLQQQQRFKEQQRCCISQQDLTEAIARMKPTLNGCRVRRRATLADASHMSTLSSSMEGLTNSSVSQLIRGFEARTTAVITPYASARDLLPIVNDDDSCNRAESNRSHMPRTAKIKGTSNENDIINNNVCSSISRFIDDDNRMITVEGDQHQLTGDREHDDDAIHQPPPASSERHKQECPTSSSSSVSVPVKNSPRSSGRHMATTRSTDIDAAASAMGNRHEIQLDDLLTKETQLNNALADLLSISTDQQQQQPRRKNSISASIDLLNNLLETFDQDKAEGDTNQNPVKPINMFWYANREVTLQSVTVFSVSCCQITCAPIVSKCLRRTSRLSMQLAGFGIRIASCRSSKARVLFALHRNL